MCSFPLKYTIIMKENKIYLYQIWETSQQLAPQLNPLLFGSILLLSAPFMYHTFRNKRCHCKKQQLSLYCTMKQISEWFSWKAFLKRTGLNRLLWNGILLSTFPWQILAVACGGITCIITCLAWGDFQGAIELWNRNMQARKEELCNDLKFLNVCFFKCLISCRRTRGVKEGDEWVRWLVGSFDPGW